MSTEDRTTSARRRPWLTCSLVLAAVGALLVGPGVAGAGGVADDDAQIVAEAKQTEKAIVAAWNNRKWDELAPLYAEDALVLAPNQEPVRGRAAIIEYFKQLRDVAGDIAESWEHLRVKGSGNFASIAGLFAVQSGRVRMTYNDLYERQPDGSVLMAVNAFGFREQPVG